VLLLDAGVAKAARSDVQLGGDRQDIAGGQKILLLELPPASAQPANGLGQPQQGGDDQ
jgi:hypothetical protein